MSTPQDPQSPEPPDTPPESVPPDYGAPPPGYGAPPPGYGAPPPGYGAPPPGYGQPPPGYPPAPYGYPAQSFGVDPRTGVPYSDKSRVVAGILQLVLGVFGAGRWYTGHTGIALAQLFTCGGLGIWALIDGILMLTGKVTDAQGRPLQP